MNQKTSWCGYLHAWTGNLHWRRAWWMSERPSSGGSPAGRDTVDGAIMTIFQTSDNRIVIVNEEHDSWPDISNGSPAVVAGPFESLRAARVAYELLRD